MYVRMQGLTNKSTLIWQYSRVEQKEMHVKHATKRYLCLNKQYYVIAQCLLYSINKEEIGLAVWLPNILSVKKYQK